MRESVLSIDKFNTPKILDGSDTTSTLIIRLLLLYPGTIQSHPEMGVGLIEKWRFCDIEKLPDLEQEIHAQISTYLPSLLLNTIVVRYQKKLLVIEVHIDSGVYVFGTEEFNNVTLLDILEA